jgi:hypothetical protein
MRGTGGVNWRMGRTIEALKLTHPVPGSRHYQIDLVFKLTRDSVTTPPACVVDLTPQNGTNQARSHNGVLRVEPRFHPVFRVATAHWRVVSATSRQLVEPGR